MANIEWYRAILDAGQDPEISNADVGRAAGVSRERVSQILGRGAPPGPEVEFWDAPPDKTITVAVGEKTEAPKAAAGPLGPVLTAEAREAWDFLRELTDWYGLAADYESIQQPGFIRLNRRGLLVICGPRLSPQVADVLSYDDAISFTMDDDGWYIIDHRQGREWRSPMDDGEMGDIGYLARLPRPDGRGNFLYIGGVHGGGTSGVAHYLSRNLPTIWSETKTSRFSALISCTLTPARRVESSELIAGPYLHER
jgi:hypothetical protein